MDFRKSAIASLLFLLLTMSSCKKQEQVELSDLTGNWIENTTEPYKIELEILSDGTMYISYQDTSTNYADTGLVNITGVTELQFDMSSGTKSGRLIYDPKTLEIDDFEQDIFPTITSFIPN